MPRRQTPQVPEWPKSGPTQPEAEKLVMLGVKVQPTFLLALSQYISRTEPKMSRGRFLQTEALKNEALLSIYLKIIRDQASKH